MESSTPRASVFSLPFCKIQQDRVTVSHLALCVIQMIYLTGIILFTIMGSQLCLVLLLGNLRGGLTSHAKHSKGLVLQLHCWFEHEDPGRDAEWSPADWVPCIA